LINYSWDEFDGQETKNVCQVAVNYALSNFVMIYLQKNNLLQQMVTAFKNRPFVPLDTSEVKSNLQIFEEVVKDSIKNFTLKFDLWFKSQYNFDLYKEASSSANNTSVDFTKLFQNAWVLLYETNENIFKSKEPFKTLEEELKTIEKDHRSIGLNQSNINNAPVGNVQQSLPLDSAEVQRNEIRNRLQEFEKKLRKLIFDKSPKTAN
jgi:hypothetical protein